MRAAIQSFEAVTSAGRLSEDAVLCVPRGEKVTLRWLVEGVEQDIWLNGRAVAGKGDAEFVAEDDTRFVLVAGTNGSARESAIWVDVIEAGECVSAHAVVGDAGARVAARGRLAIDGEALAHAAIVLVAGDGSEHATTTDAEGAWTVEDFPSGRYRIRLAE